MTDWFETTDEDYEEYAEIACEDIDNEAELEALITASIWRIPEADVQRRAEIAYIFRSTYAKITRKRFYISVVGATFGVALIYAFLIIYSLMRNPSGSTLGNDINQGLTPFFIVAVIWAGTISFLNYRFSYYKRLAKQQEVSNDN